jgi:hypothetical protein
MSVACMTGFNGENNTRSNHMNEPPKIIRFYLPLAIAILSLTLSLWNLYHGFKLAKLVDQLQTPPTGPQIIGNPYDPNAQERLPADLYRHVAT